jgi:hypothetical protein
MEEKKQIAGECKACKTAIVFLYTSKNKLIPVNPENVDKEDIFYNYKKHVTHFITCPRAEIFRKPAQIDPEEEKRRMEAAFFKSLEKFKERLRNDSRKFITHNAHEITMPRYALLEVCSESGMSYEDLVNKTNSEMREWLAEKGMQEKEEKQLSLI